MKNTIEDKVRFFALYWGQKAGGNLNWDYLLEVGDSLLKFDYLELKPLSQISDEDALCLSKKLYGQNSIYASIDDGATWAKNVYQNSFEAVQIEELIVAVDFLRSKGYALPWMGVSVEQQLEWDWIKLKEL